MWHLQQVLEPTIAMLGSNAIASSVYSAVKGNEICLQGYKPPSIPSNKCWEILEIYIHSVLFQLKPMIAAAIPDSCERRPGGQQVPVVWGEVVVHTNNQKIQVVQGSRCMYV